MSALDRQVGGNHYKGLVIQPAEYITRNGLGFLAGNVIKRITRYNQETGKGLEDLQKIIHEVELLIEIEGWDMTETLPEPPDCPKKHIRRF